MSHFTPFSLLIYIILKVLTYDGQILHQFQDIKADDLLQYCLYWTLTLKNETEFQICGKHSGKVVSRCEGGMRIIACLTRVCVLRGDGSPDEFPILVKHSPETGHLRPLS